MTVGIVGLGLIGGSMAKAYHEAGHQVLAYDRDTDVTSFAILSGAADAELTAKNLEECQLLLLAVYPQAAADYLTANAERIATDATVLDCCGTKRMICEVGFRVASEQGFLFVGGHPMAGTHFSGFKHSRANLFRNAPMVLVPPVYDDMQLLERVCKLLAAPGFGRFSVTTAERHDEMIAFTSQLAHIVSNAYVKSPTASLHKGFSAGSYQDLTRVAWLNPQMWTELFLENRDFLTHELDTLIHELQQYRQALEISDAQALCRLLEEGRKRKEEVG